MTEVAVARTIKVTVSDISDAPQVERLAMLVSTTSAGLETDIDRNIGGCFTYIYNKLPVQLGAVGHVGHGEG